MNNIDNIKRSLEEDILQDVVNKDIPPYTPGVDAYNDVNVPNDKLSQINQKFRALLSLLYMKESSILDVKKEDATQGSIFINKETNSIEYFDGQVWKSNIFAPNNILDSGTYTVNDLGKEERNGIVFSNVASINVNLSISIDKIVFIVVDGTLVDKSRYYFKPNNKHTVYFTTPVTVYENLSYYVLGSTESVSGSVPRFEVATYVCDGNRSVFPISNDPNFIVTYRSSIQVTIDGVVLRQDLYTLNENRNKVILNTPPKLGSHIEIKTLYGCTTDFRSNVSYVEQIQRASINNQKTFTYNGVSDAIKVYLDGKRLVLNEHYKFDYVRKLVILNDDITNTVRKDSLVVIEKELAPMSKEPMYGILITEAGQLKDSAFTLKSECNGITCVILSDDMDGSNKEVLLQQDYFLNDNILNISKQSSDKKYVQVTYLSNSQVELQSIPQVNDQYATSQTDVWSIDKVSKELSNKLDSVGNKKQDIDVRSLNAYGDVSVDGNLINKNNLHSKNVTISNKILVGTERNPIFTNDEESGNFKLGLTTVFNKDIIVHGNFTLHGTYTGRALEIVNIESNSLELNHNKEDTEEPVDKSSIIVNRGKNGKAYLTFVEEDKKWKVSEDNKNEVALSLEGHTHEFKDIIGVDGKLPVSNALFTYDNTDLKFYEKDKLETFLKDACKKEKDIVSLSLLTLNKTKLKAIEDNEDGLTSGTILRYDIVFGIQDDKTNKKTHHINALSIIEDGSIIMNAKSVLAIPSGKETDKWDSIENWNSKLESLDNNQWKNRNGLLRYNEDLKALEVKIDGTWVRFHKPDIKETYNTLPVNYDRQRLIYNFSMDDFTQLNILTPTEKALGFKEKDFVLKIRHKFNSLYVGVEIFDDKRTTFPLIYKCVDENNVYLTFPSNMHALSGGVELKEWMEFLSQTLHSNHTSEGPGHENKINTSKQMDLSKKFVAFIREL